MVFQGSESTVLVFFCKNVFRKSFGTEFSSKNMIALLEKGKLDGKHGPRRAKEGLKEAKNATQGPMRSLMQTQRI